MKTFLKIIGIIFVVILLVFVAVIAGIAMIFDDEEFQEYMHDDEVLRNSRTMI